MEEETIGDRTKNIEAKIDKQRSDSLTFSEIDMVTNELLR